MEEAKGVTPVAVPTTPPVVETQTPPVSEDVKPQEPADYKALYEKAKEEAENKARALKETREKEKAEREARLALEAQMQSQAQAPQQDNDEAVQMFYENKAKTDLLTLAVTDPFVKDNFNLVLEAMSQNPMAGAEVAAMRVKSNIMDGIIKSADLAKPEPVAATPTPGAVPENQNYETFAGDEQSVIDQMEAKLKGIR
jgi:hypothetical protein